jgi:hypothetical protein
MDGDGGRPTADRRRPICAIRTSVSFQRVFESRNEIEPGETPLSIGRLQIPVSPLVFTDPLPDVV